MLRISLLAVLLSPLLAAEEGWLGVFLADAETEARIAEVIPGSPAEAAGLRPGDVIVEVDRRATATVEAFVAAIQSLEAGARVRLRVRRGDAEIDIDVRLGVRPGDPRPSPPPPAFLGVAVVSAERGVVVNEVLVDSPAAQAGIAAGDRIVRIHGQAVRSLDDVDRVMSGLVPGREVAVNVQNERGSASLLIRLGARPVDRLETAAGPGATAGPETAPGPAVDRELEARLRRAEQEVERLGQELRALMELQGELEELQRLREELAELRGALRDLLRRDR